MLYTVGEMAKVLGIPASTLRYYDKEWPNEGMSPLSQNVLHYSNPEGTLSKNN